MVFRKEQQNMKTELKTAITDHGAMDYFSFGNEQGEVLAVLPGLSLVSTMRAAAAIVSAYSVFAKEYHVYFFDRIREFPEGYDISDMADDTLRAFQDAGIEKAHVMGVSQGGMIALAMALKSPETIRSLVLCSSASRIPESSRPVFENWQKLAENRELRKLSESFGKAVFTPAFYEDYKIAIIGSNDRAAEEDFVRFIASISGTKDFDVYDRLEEIKCPLFVIGASRDMVLGEETSREIIEKLNCRGYIYEGYGHGAYDEAPDYRARVKEFLDTVR
jgi:pimeloyl-ACP methyl ester carboxylesterase